MATQEKLLKSLEALKNLINSNQNADSSSRKKDKIQHCNFITEAMSNPTIKIAPNFVNLLSFSVETFLQLCDDPESDIRMIADESLNRIIKAMNNGNIGKVQIELHKEIKKNGAARSLRAALIRFTQLTHLIRPHKGKPYIINLIPCIVKISEREEEIIHESLATCLPKILSFLGSFATDNDIKALLKAFLSNVHRPSAVIRRTTASCILATCLNCRKPYVFITYVLNSLVEFLVPVQEAHSTSLILCILGCLKTIIPYIKNTENKQEIKGSFGRQKEINEVPAATDRLLQTYELCLHYTNHSDHNVINASLETLNILLQNCPTELKTVLLAPSGILKSRIHIYDESSKSRQRSPSQLSVATTFLSGDENINLEAELTDTLKTDIERWIDESKLSVMNVTYAKTAEIIEKQHTVSVSDTTTTGSSFEHIDTSDYSNITIGTISDQCGDSVKSESFADNLDKLVLSENSSEKSFSHCAEDKGLSSSTDNILYQDVDIGDIMDKDVPLIFCTRHITKSFLLTGSPNGTIPDKTIRVSVKSLALSCLSTIFQLYPQGLLLYLDKSCAKISSGFKNIQKQQITDVLLFANHQDPQLRGCVRLLLGSFIKAALLENEGMYYNWIIQNSLTCDLEVVHLEKLMDIFIKGLEDESSTCTRQSLSGLQLCINYIIDSIDSRIIIPILHELPLLAKNPYWLVKVKLVELLADIQYVTIHYILDRQEFQDQVLFNVFFELLKDDDQRVRNACSNAIVKVVRNLYFQQDDPKESSVTKKAMFEKKKYLSNLSSSDFEIYINKKNFINNMAFPFKCIDKQKDFDIEVSLSRVINKLHQYFLVSTSKHFIYGCVETLCLLSTGYPPTIYKTAWSCFKAYTMQQDKNVFQRSVSSNDSLPTYGDIEVNSTDLLGICINMLTHSTFGYDFNFHLNILKFTGNLFSGICIQNLKPASEIPPDESKRLWDIFSDKTLADLAEQFLNHVIKLLSTFTHVLDEVSPIIPQAKTVLPNLPAPSTLSPIKRKKSDLTDKSRILSPGKTADKDDKSDKRSDVKLNSMGYFANIPHYMKIYELLRIAYNNYKITLDIEASGNFTAFLNTTLLTLSQILEVATLFESGRIAEEILSYLRATFSLEAATTVECVQQLLKSLFGSNLSSNISEISSITSKNSVEKKAEDIHGFYFNISQKPYNDVSSCIKGLHNINKYECNSDSTVMGYLHRREAKKIISAKGSDKILANYIRIFEAMVIKSLKQYTITSDVRLQCRVLQLLSQLVRLRVNYCLLDSEQIFIGFVLKQFEFIEEGQIIYTNELVPKIFQFLVHLSYGKQHSKTIIDIPKIIHLCDGLMASGQSPRTHCIPAIVPIVEDIFLLRNRSNTSDFKELETTREVLLSMLLRLFEYHEVIDLLVLILHESKYCDNAEKWLRWSAQIVDVMVPMLRQNKVQFNNTEAFVSMKKLIYMLNPSSLKPINEFLVMLFQEPPTPDDSLNTVNHWLGKITSLLLILLQTKEDIFLLKILEMQVDFHPSSIFYKIIYTPDPLNVTAIANFFDGIDPEMVFLRFIFRAIDIAAVKCLQVAKNEETNFIAEQLSILLMFCLYIFQSGSHCKTTNLAIDLINNESKLKSNDIKIESINTSFIKMGIFHPTLTFQWCYLLLLLNYHNKEFWSSVLSIDSDITTSEKRSYKSTKCINLEIVQTGACIVICDYMAENVSKKDDLEWFLSNYIELIVDLSEEAPIFEFLASVHRSQSCCALFLDNIFKKCLQINDPLYKRKILTSIENVHSSQAGNLLYILLMKLLDTKQLALSRLVATLASRKIEFLLTLTMDEVHNQLPKEKLVEMTNFLVVSKLAKRHETMASLLNKLSTQFYDLSPIEFAQRRAVNPEYIKKLQINKAWYLSQIKSRCCDCSKKGVEVAELLNKLEYDNLLELMNVEDFEKNLLSSCIGWSVRKMKESPNEGPLDLFRASVDVLLKGISSVVSTLPKPHQVYGAIGRTSTISEEKYTVALQEIFGNSQKWLVINNLTPATSHYIKSLSIPNSSKIPDNHSEDLVKFAVICLESVTYLIDVYKSNININYLDQSLSCADFIFKEVNLCNILALDSHVTWLCSSVNSVYKIVSYLLLNEEPLPCVGKDGLKPTLANLETLSAGHACYQLSVLVAWLERLQNCTVKMPKFLFRYLQSIIVSLARLPLLNSYILTPPTAWKSGWDPVLSGSFNTQVPPLPIRLLQEIEILEEYIFRMTLVGWTTRQQFEETWMCLLSVLSPTPSEFSIPEEANAITHASSLAVEAITSLLMETLYDPMPGNRNISKLVHVPRELFINDISASVLKLMRIHSSIENMYADFSKSKQKLENVFYKTNLDKQSSGHSYSQVSVEYLAISSKIIDMVYGNSRAVEIYKKRQKILELSGLDLHSCLQFLLELYSQWLKSLLTTPLRLLHEVMRSILLISDLFTEKSQFTWMLESCMELSKTHTTDDEILHQYVVIGICKAAAVIMPDMESLESIKKTLVQSLKSAFLPTRIASLHGLLYLLQGCLLANTIIGGVSEEMQLFLPIAIEYVQANISNSTSVLYQSQEHGLLVWALAFYLIENISSYSLEQDFGSNIVQVALSNMTSNKFNTTTHNAITKGLERLVIKRSLPEHVNSQILKFAINKMKSSNPVISIPAVQLLLTCMYTECNDQLERTEIAQGIVQSNPDNLVQTIEKVSAIFDKIKKGYPSEVELLCAFLPRILNDFFPPSDILTKVIGEFLSPQQRHAKLLSRVVFQVFESAINTSQLLLLQDWVVFSLSNFTQLVPIGMATWCLTCFFISASTNEWLRSLFPYIQSRIGRYEYEDKKMLCIAGADFFNNLTNELQKKTFVETFQKVKDQPDTPFNDLLASL